MPGPKAESIELTEPQETILEQIIVSLVNIGIGSYDWF